MFEVTGIGGLLGKAQLVLRREGFLAVIGKAIFCHHRNYIWEQQLDVLRHMLPQQCKVGGLTLRTFFIPFTLEEFERRFSYSYDEPAPKIYDFSGYKDATIYSNRSELCKGTVVFECLVDNEVIHRSWAATCREGCGVYQHYYPASLDDGNTAYGGFTITSQSYRGKGLSTYVHDEMYRYLRERGFSKVVGNTMEDGVAASKTHVKLGSRLFGEGHSVRLLLLFNFRWIRRRTELPLAESSTSL